MNSVFRCVLAISAALWLSGCQGSDSNFKTAQQLSKDKPQAEGAAHDEHESHDGHGHEGHDHGDHDHHHDAPHGGGIVMLGDHVGHFEIVVDPAAGTITAYVLDGNAEKPVGIDQKELSATITPEVEEGNKGAAPASDAAIQIKFTVVEGSDPPGSVFAAQSDQLKGIGHFDFKLVEITVDDKQFKNQTIHFEPAEPKTETKTE